ncbi:N-acetylmuramidase family protein [Phyllobacterium sp. BT25]|uniref:N-acetylmuramidase family protein n=1 Tax=Phyllobacterium pellucidum TaxID=2740464 RepID=A0A849VMX7_9HYPH|nr:N-acetylmuramidase family protein [Phyllobacterium pellucidum]NTS31248.1 N-acetylmuramidase family protein [Phyllobacterium pellucidum]
MFYIGKALRLSDADFARLASAYGIEEAALRAVAEVEARGEGFYSSGALVCLYEPHIAYKYTSGSIRNALVLAGLAYEKWGTKPYPKSSLPNIDRCAKIAGEEVAAKSTSWGLGQIMGFNYPALGQPSAVAMVKWFAESEGNQLEGMVLFIKSNPAMLTALKAKDWAGFAKRYNGSAYAKNKYDTKLAAAYAKWSKKVATAPAPPPVTVPVSPAPPPAPLPVEQSPAVSPPPLPTQPQPSPLAALIQFFTSLFTKKA